MSEKARIRWLCRRGMKELDVLLERFVNSEYDDLSPSQHEAFVELLGYEDPDLLALLMGRAEPDNPEQAELITQIRKFQRV